jgi:hypothetical protein
MWDISNMAGKEQKKLEAEARAREIANRLERIRPQGLTDRQWCLRAGVSPSFFSNLKGTASKRPSEPSVGNLRAMLCAAKTTLPDFFADEAEGRSAVLPTAEELELRIRELLPTMPWDPDKFARMLAQGLSLALGLPAAHATTPANLDPSDPEEQPEGAQAPVANT